MSQIGSMSDEDEKKKSPPSPEEIQKDLHEFFKGKFGENVIISPVGGGGMGANAQAEAPPEEEEARRERRASVLSFDMKPTQVKQHLDRYVIGQDEAKRSLAVAVCDHYNHAWRAHELEHARPDREDDKGREDGKGDGEKDTVAELDYVKQNVILLGPTGVGKTYLIRILAQLIGVPFAKADITKFSETGYVGNDVDDLVRELVRSADGDIELAEYGMVFLDEIDKIATSDNSLGRDVSGRGVQTGLLKLLEETEVPARSPNDLSAQFQEVFQMRGGKAGKRTINTRHVLFVVSGAFSGMGEIIEKRLSERNIGFGARGPDDGGADDRSLFAQVSTKDFVDFGFEPEFIGRLPIRVALDDLSEDDLFDILTTSEGSILKQHRESFRGYGIQVEFTNDALRAVAKKAKEEQTGARGLMTVLESTLRDFKFYLPDEEVKRFMVTLDVIENPQRELEAILKDPKLAERGFDQLGVGLFEDEFERQHGARLELDESAVAMAVAVSSELHLTVSEYLQNTFRDHVEFLQKLTSETGRRRFPVTPQILNRPGDGVDLWLKRDEE